MSTSPRPVASRDATQTPEHDGERDHPRDRRIRNDLAIRKFRPTYLTARERPKPNACTEAFIGSDLDRSVGAFGGLAESKGDGMLNADGVHRTKRPRLDTANRGFDRRQPCAMLTTECVQEFGPAFARNINGRHYAPRNARETERRQLHHLFKRSGLFEQMRGAGNDLEFDGCRHLPHRVAIHLDHRSSSPPTISSVGVFTFGSARPARSGRPPRETTARVTAGRSAAPMSAAAAPVLAPKGYITEIL